VAENNAGHHPLQLLVDRFIVLVFSLQCVCSHKRAFIPQLVILSLDIIKCPLIVSV